MAEPDSIKMIYLNSTISLNDIVTPLIRFLIFPFNKTHIYLRSSNYFLKKFPLLIACNTELRIYLVKISSICHQFKSCIYHFTHFSQLVLNYIPSK